MILYHGSNQIVSQINLGQCRPYRDFGTGFYLTVYEDQAKRMASRVARLFGGKEFVNIFNYNQAASDGLSIRVFDKPTMEWAQSVFFSYQKSNRVAFIQGSVGMSKLEQLIEYIVRDIIEYYVLDEKAGIKEAMTLFYDSEIFEKLHNSETGLYLCSSALVYDLFRDEISEGRIVQKEI